MSSLIQKHAHVKGQRSNHHIFKFQPNPSWAKKGQTVTRPYFAPPALMNNIKFEPRHKISNNVVCATTKASDQPAHTHSLIRAFASHLNIL